MRTIRYDTGTLRFNRAPRHESVFLELEAQLHAFLTPTLDGGEWSASRTGRFIPRERTPGTHWIRGWVVPRAGLNAVVKRKIPSPPSTEIMD